MKDNFKNGFIVGMLMMLFCASVIVMRHPTPAGDIACGRCGALEWYFKIAKGDEDDNDFANN